MESKLKHLSYNPTPVQEIRSSLLEKYGLSVLIKREDLNHPFVSGNKWWKLKYNLEETQRQGKRTVLTFGGSYSNHIYATAAASSELGLQSIGIIRGEEILPLNSTLQFAREKGMALEFVSRESYKQKESREFHERLKEKYGDFYPIPEGGTNELAVQGCAEFAQTLSPLSFDYLCLPVGTGGTMAGIISGLNKGKVLGYSVLKDGSFLNQEVSRQITPDAPTRTEWRINTDYAFGGYAKTTPELLHFIKAFEQQHAVPLDQVYTGKMMYGVFDLVEKGYFERGTTILVVHTGGLQGRLPSLD